MHLSVIIPAYNEAKRITNTLISIRDYLSKQPYDWEVLVVNDGSKDNTVEIVSDFAKQNPGFRLIDNKENHGKGYAVKQGMLEAKGDYCLFTDADNSTTIDHIEKFWPYFNQGHDLVIGSRRTEGAVIEVKQPWIRDFLGGVFRLMVRMLVPLKVTDSQAGFKAFSKNAADIIFKKQTIFRWAFDVEILAIARRAGLKIKEVPIIWKNDLESKVKFSGMVKMLFEVLKVRWNLITGRYK